MHVPPARFSWLWLALSLLAALTSIVAPAVAKDVVVNRQLVHLDPPRGWCPLQAANLPDNQLFQELDASASRRLVLGIVKCERVPELRSRPQDVLPEVGFVVVPMSDAKIAALHLKSRAEFIDVAAGLAGKLDSFVMNALASKAGNGPVERLSVEKDEIAAYIGFAMPPEQQKPRRMSVALTLINHVPVALVFITPDEGAAAADETRATAREVLRQLITDNAALAATEPAAEEDEGDEAGDFDVKKVGGIGGGALFFIALLRFGFRAMVGGAFRSRQRD